jgi:uncharacterized membrane protein YoaT (DUF817 family)
MQPTVKKFIFSALLAFASLLTASFFWNKPFVATIILASLSVLMLLVDRKKQNLILYFCVFVSGPIAEAIAVYFGAWNYTYPFIAGIPLWLPFVWGNSSLYIVQIKALIESF